VNDHQKLEKRVEVLLEHLSLNSKKMKQECLQLGTINSKRLDATIRIAKELMIVSNLINELWENPSELIAYS
jgi:hypothetical protein